MQKQMEKNGIGQDCKKIRTTNKTFCNITRKRNILKEDRMLKKDFRKKIVNIRKKTLDNP